MSHLPFLTVDSSQQDKGLDDGALDTDASRHHPTPSASSTIASTIKMSSHQDASDPQHSSWLRFPLAVVISLALSAVLHSNVPELAGYELATVSRTVDEPWQVLLLVGWRVFEIGVAWASGLDCENLTPSRLLCD